MELAKFMASSTGRIVRIVAGLILMALGIWVVESTLWQWVLIIVGLVPIAAGLFDFCLLAALFGAPLSGEELRRS